MIKGLFEVAHKLYGLTFKTRHDIPVYHKDVQVFEVVDANKENHIGVLYVDLFPRAGKRAGAWMTNYQEQGWCQGEVKRSHVAIVANLTKPSGKSASLLTLDEVLTLFHEFGHSLHSLMSQCRYRSLAGTNVLWDFVELPFSNHGKLGLSKRMPRSICSTY